MGATRAALVLGAVLTAAAAVASGGSGVDPRTPPGLPGLPPPFLGVAVVGSGGRTAAVDAYGDVVDLRAPGPAGRGLVAVPAERQAAGSVSQDTAIVARMRLPDGRLLPLWRADSVRQRYLPGTNVLRTTAPLGGKEIEIVQAIRGRLVECLSGEGASIEPEPCPSRPISAAARSDWRWLARARPLGAGAPPWAIAMYHRSLLVLRALTDRRTGAVAAGARDSWAYVWPRDAGVVAIALASAGYRPEARRVVRFLLNLNLDAAARFRGTGAPVAGRDAQGDAAGWVAAAARAVGISRNGANDAGGWRDRADYQEGDNGAYLANAIASTEVTGDKQRGSKQDALPTRGRGTAQLRRMFETSSGLIREAGDPGSGLDSAAAWAVRPFPIPALFPAVRRTLHRLVAERESRFGIVPSESWSGGKDPWTAPTAWSAWTLAVLAQSHWRPVAGLPGQEDNEDGANGSEARARKDRRAALSLMADLRRAATPLGLLPERVDARTGIPRSTTPLAWSHAFAILALRELWARTGQAESETNDLKSDGHRLLGGFGGDDAGTALHLIPSRDAPAAQGDHGPPQIASVRDLRERAPLAADGDRDLARCDDGEVAGLADPGRDHLGAVRVRVVRGDPGEDADRGAARPRRTTGDRFHYPTPATADHGHIGLGQQSPDLLGESPRLGLLPAPSGPDHRNLPRPSPLAHPGSKPFIDRISSSAPCLCSGSLRLPHLGLCTQEGQPDSHGHSAISRSASPSRRSNCS